MKKRFLFTILPTNDLGLLTRSLPIAKALTEQGHSIVFSHPARAPQKLIKEAGFENIRPKHPLFEIDFSAFSFHTLKILFKSPEIKENYGSFFWFVTEFFRTIPYKSAPHTHDVWDMDHASAISGLLNEYFVYTQCLAYIKVIEASCADVVVDFWNPFATIACRYLGKPLITINQADALPGSRGFIWWKKKPENIPTVVPVLNKVLNRFNLKPVSHLNDLNVGDLTLVMGIPETDPLNGKHQFDHIGPILWENPDTEIPAWFDELPPDRPVIWVYSGNPRYSGSSKIFSSDILLPACFDALGSEPYQVVLTTGHQPLPKKLGSIPANFRFVTYVPGLMMAKRCNLMIHHGGYGSCQTGLYTGTPSLIIPTFSERESNARRIASLGAGELVLPRIDKQKKRRIDPVEIRMKTHRILEHSEYRKSAELLGAKLRSYGGVAKAVELIENFMKSI